MPPPAVELADVTFTYRGRDLPALSHISLRVPPGTVLTVLGHSGAGKSTLLASLAAVVPAVKRGDFAGDVRILGESLAGRRPRDLAGRVAWVVEDFDAALVATTVEEEVAFGPRYLGVPAADIGALVAQTLGRCGLAGMESRRVATLSGGQKQRLAVAAALATGARVLLLDEAATDLDPAGKEALARLAREWADDGGAVVAADNDGHAAADAARVIMLSQGRAVADGDPLAVLSDAGLCDAAGVLPLPYLRHFTRDGVALRPGPGVVPRAATPAPGAEPPAGSPLVVAAALRFAYPGGAAALAGFDLAVAAGDFLALVGENGGGKTTFAKALAGLLRPAAGTLTVAGESPAALPTRRRACLVGYLFQNPDHQIFRPTVAEEILFGPRQLGLDGAALTRRLEAALAATGLVGREEEDPFALAKGDRQRVALASVLAMEPEILVMDEPTTGLDRREVASLMAAVTALNRQGTTVIFITHAMDVVARYARRVAVVSGGRVIGEGTVRRVLTDDGLLARAGLRPPLPLRLGRALGVECLTDDELTAALDAPGPGER